MGDSKKLTNEEQQGGGAAARLPADDRRAPLWLWPNLLSRDAPLVAVVWELLFARSSRLSVTPATTLCLGLAVWLLYVADRLLDARQLRPPQEVAPRHNFYRDHGHAFVPLLAAGSLLGAWLAWTRLDAGTVLHGLGMLGAVALYFALVHFVPAHRRRWLPKELAVAVLFAAGCLLPVWQASFPTLPVIFAWALFVLACWINTALIEESEYERVRARRAPELHPWSAALGRRPVEAAAGVALTASAFVPVLGASAARLVLPAVALGALGLLMVGRRRERLSPDALRVLADFVLLVPGVMLLVH